MKNDYFLFSFTEQFRFEVIFFSFKFQELSIVNLEILYQCNLKDSQKATQDHISPTFQISKKIIWRSVASQQATLSFSPNYSENCGFTASDTILFSDSLIGINRSFYLHIAENISSGYPGQGVRGLAPGQGIDNVAQDILVRLG